jgi:hypothetical protein
MKIKSAIRSVFLFIIAFLPLLILVSCQDHKDTSAETFGQIDSLQIATDTAMQTNMDRSYEYQRSLVQNDTTVFDFLAYDKPKGSSSPDWESKFIVIRRTASAGDTVIRGFRTGAVQSLWLSDLDANGKPEIMFYEYPRPTDQATHPVEFIAYESDGRKNARSITTDFKEDAQHYIGKDSFFIAQGYLIRKMPYYMKTTDSIPVGTVWQSYKMARGKLILDKEKKVLQ